MVSLFMQTKACRSSFPFRATVSPALQKKNKKTAVMGAVIELQRLVGVITSQAGLFWAVASGGGAGGECTAMRQLRLRGDKVKVCQACLMRFSLISSI